MLHMLLQNAAFHPFLPPSVLHLFAVQEKPVVFFLLLLERYSNLCKCYCSVGVSNSTSCHEVVTSSGTFTDVLPPQGKLISEDSGTDSAASAAGVDKIRGTHHSSSIQLRLSSRDICRQEFCARRARRTSVE